MRADHGSGSILAVGVLAALVAVTMMLLPLSAVLVGRQGAAHAADAAALAAADVAAGLSPGSPCGAAKTMAERNGAVLVECTIDGATATVGVAVAVGNFSASGRATAGQPLEAG